MLYVKIQLTKKTTTLEQQQTTLTGHTVGNFSVSLNWTTMYERAFFYQFIATNIYKVYLQTKKSVGLELFCNRNAFP